MKIRKYNLEFNTSGMIQMIKESEHYFDGDSLSNASSVVSMVNRLFNLNKKAEEYVYMVALDTASHPLGVFEISHGTASASLIQPREIMQRALLCGATRFIILHNHPSGAINPSNDDMHSASIMEKAASLMRIPMLDFIIVGKDYFSFNENNLIGKA